MNFFIVVLAICLFISLFFIYILSREDLILIRKDVSMEKLFNTAILIFITGLLFSRIVYAAMHSPRMFLNPLVFLLFPYFPGLSLIGGVLGALVFFLFFGKVRSLPTGRIIDFFSIGFLSSLPIGYLGYFVLTGGKNIPAIIISAFYLSLTFLFMKYLYQFLLRGILKDGSLGLIFLTVFSLVSFFQKVLDEFRQFAFIKQPEGYLMLLLFFISVSVFIKNERLVKIRKR